jgi:hypothetical protein
MASYVAIGAMAGYVDSRTGIGVDHHIDPNLKGGDGCKIFAFDTSKFFTAGGLKTKTTSIRIEADVSHSHNTDFISGFECFVGGESGSFGAGAGGGYDIRYRRNPIRI